MVETYTPKPLSERESQSVGATHVLGWFGKILAIVFGTGIAVNLGSRALGIKIKVPERIAKWMNAHPLYTLLYNPNELGPRELGMLSGKIAGIVTAFMGWRKVEQERLGVDDMYTHLPEMIAMHKSNEDILRDNALVQRMIAFEQEKQQELLAHSTAPTTTIAATPEEHGRVEEKEKAVG